MRRFALVPSFVLLAPALALTAACSSSSSGSGGGGGGASTPPHALGAIVLGESHAPGSALSMPVVSAGFVPDSSEVAAACTTQVAGCTVATAPKCGTTGCPSGTTCEWSSTCQAVCQPACALTCGMGQECYFASPGQPACRTIETFDAGALVFVGTTSPITLYPPYSYPGTAGMAPYAPSAMIQVQASGATAAGFDSFTVNTTGTTLVQTTPPLDTIPKTTVFGLGALPVGWVAGSDTVTVSLSGAAAS